MACESDKCEKYGMHHDYKNGVEIRKCIFCEQDNQPERSKREDFKSYDDYNLDCGCHAEPGMFSRHNKCNLDHVSLIP